MFVDDFSKIMQQENVHLEVIYVPSVGGHICILTQTQKFRENNGPFFIP